jgi:hypothetical protein
VAAAAVLLAVASGSVAVALVASLGDGPATERPPAANAKVDKGVPTLAENKIRGRTRGPRAKSNATPAAAPPGEGKRPPTQPVVRNHSTADANQVVVARPPQTAKPTAEPARLATKPVAGVLERLRASRRSHLTDEELRKQLLLVPEVNLHAVPGTAHRLMDASRKVAGTGVDLVPRLVTGRPDLVGLPVRTGDANRISREAALNLQVLSQHLRRQLEASIPGIAEEVVDLRPDPKVLRKQLLDHPSRGKWLVPEGVPALRQLLMHEHQHVRLILVEALSRIDGAQATQAIAERALFDLHPEVRAAAVAALKGRPVCDFESVLLGGFRYPWPAVADHAAEALIALDHRPAVSKLVLLLEDRDLDEPYPVPWGKKRVPVVPQLVRTSHLRNCLLCHGLSFAATDPVRGLVPNCSRLLPLPSSGVRVCSSRGGYGAGGSTSVGRKRFTVKETYVRADITYLRQDFSVLQPVPSHGRLWPADQRFDYMVRLRPIGKKELTLWQDQLKDLGASTPQREALLFALRELTGEDLGPTPADWQRLHSPVTGERLSRPQEGKDRVRHLTDSLVKAALPRQTQLLLAFKDRRGPDYDLAMALALPRLPAEVQSLGRMILAERMYCLPFKDLQAKLRDDHPEVRRAAVTACGLRKEQALVPELITLLDQEEAEEVQQARRVLRQLTAQDFGPTPKADPDKRCQAITAWLDWWDREARKQAAQPKRNS